MNELMVEFKEFRRFEEREHEEIKEKLSNIENKLEDLSAFKWKTYGAVSVIAFVVSGFGVALFSHVIN